MLRSFVALLALTACLSTCPSVASAARADGCKGFELGTFLSAVPYFSKRMVASGGSREDGVTLTHQDDERIRAVFRLVPAQASPGMTRADFLKEIEDALARRAADERSLGNKVQTGLFPYDPVSWTVVRTVPSEGGGTEGRGDLTVRVAPTCHLTASWRVPDDRVLAARVQEFGVALTAVRTLAERRMAPSGFAVDEYVPTGTRALVGGFVVPLFAAVALVWLLRDMFFLDPPGAPVRAAAGVACVAALAGLAFQYQGYLDGLKEARFLDQAMLLLTATALLAAAALFGGQRATLYGLAASTIFGVSIAVTACLAWTPDRWVSAAVAVAFVAAGTFGLWYWRSRAERDGKAVGSRA